jgi:hypothetical protein
MGAISFSLDPRLVEFFRRELPLARFVETGTFRGETLRLAAQQFAECHSVELSPELYQAAAAAFAGNLAVRLHLGPSPQYLTENAAAFAASPTFFWLDAHWCSAEATAGADSQSPLLEEIAALGSLHPQSVLLIDDARLYLCPPPLPHRFTDWPAFHDIVRGLFALSDQHRLMVFNDVICFHPVTVDAALAKFVHQNGADWLEIAGQARRYRRRRERGLFRWLRRK